jgi:hypothetical protein
VNPRKLLAAILVIGAAFGTTPEAMSEPNAVRVNYIPGSVFFGGEGDQLRDRFRRSLGVDSSTRVAAGLADINFDGRAELFLTTEAREYCPNAGCDTAIYSVVDGVWKVVGGLRTVSDEDGVPLIYVREEVVDGMRTYYSSYHDPIENPGPDQLMKFGTADEMITDAEWPGLVEGLMRSWLQDYWDRDRWLYGRHALNDDGIDEVLITSAPGIGCSNLSCVTHLYSKKGDRWFLLETYVWFDALIGDDGLPKIYVRDEFREGYRTIYTNLGGPRERVPFPVSE